jgi:hypothetical protein
LGSLLPSFSGNGKKVISGDLDTKAYHMIGFLSSLLNRVQGLSLLGLNNQLITLAKPLPLITCLLITVINLHVTVAHDFRPVIPQKKNSSNVLHLADLPIASTP